MVNLLSMTVICQLICGIVIIILVKLISDEPEETPFGLRSDVGADFCLSFDTNLKGLELRCDMPTSTYPNPIRVWYKDEVVVYRASVGETPSIRDEFYEKGNNSLLQPGLIEPLPLIALTDGTLFLDWTATNVTLPQLLPDGVTLQSFRRDLFRTLLGSWECELESSLGKSEAETTLTNCGTYLCSNSKI